MARGHKTGGRKKGTPNKLTAAVKDMIIQALDNEGGVDYLQRVAKENPTAFCTLLGKVIPMQVEGGDNPIQTVTTIRLTGPNGSND